MTESAGPCLLQFNSVSVLSKFVNSKDRKCTRKLRVVVQNLCFAVAAVAGNNVTIISCDRTYNF